MAAIGNVHQASAARGPFEESELTSGATLIALQTVVIYQLAMPTVPESFCLPSITDYLYYFFGQFRHLITVKRSDSIDQHTVKHASIKLASSKHQPVEQQWPLKQYYYLRHRCVK
ncbi:hypothetical protein ColLi_10639 [Colletotrichum liriopes]|uniref:Uncharacterized protein n=1 Tax=Colletotrichum liriopes TaxID=708192 RepID=A0AA37GWR2_9PEZI|nr:hypothetical protein ColLi_10639 [Colletotrichum liriopes]